MTTYSLKVLTKLNHVTKCKWFMKKSQVKDHLKNMQWMWKWSQKTHLNECDHMT